MKQIKKYIGDLFISRRWYLLLGSCAILLFISFFIRILFQPVVAFTCAVLFFTIVDYILLFFVNGSVSASRNMSPRFSVGDDNAVELSVTNSYPFKMMGMLIDGPA